MKKRAAIFLLFAMLLLSACGGGTDSNAGKTQIDVKGVFLLEPSDQLNLSAEGLDTGSAVSVCSLRRGQQRK